MAGQPVLPKGSPPPLAPYSPGFRSGQFVCTAGMLSMDAAGNVVGAGDVRAQTRQVLENIRGVLEAAGGSLEDIVYNMIFLADLGDRQGGEWRANFVRTFVERDLPRLGTLTSPRTLADFWTMMSHYHGQVWNSSELGRAFASRTPPCAAIVNLLTDTFVVRQLPPWTENIGKRVVKSPKVYVADSGLLHTLLGIEKPADLTSHPKVGASFEGFALEQVIRRLELRPREAFFWATHAGAELDLLVIRGRRRLGFEFKRTDAPRLTRSMTVSLDTLALDRIDVIHAGSDGFRMHDKVRAVPIRGLLEALKPLA